MQGSRSVWARCANADAGEGRRIMEWPGRDLNPHGRKAKGDLSLLRTIPTTRAGGQRCLPREASSGAETGLEPRPDLGKVVLTNRATLACSSVSEGLQHKQDFLRTKRSTLGMSLKGRSGYAALPR